MSDQEKAVLLSFAVLVVFSLDLRQALKGRISGSASWKKIVEYLRGLGFAKPERTLAIIVAATLMAFLVSFAAIRFGGGE